MAAMARVAFLACTLQAAGSPIFRANSGATRFHHLDNSRKWSALHEVVGPDGVLMLYLERAGRKEYKALNEAGIYPTLVEAVDYKFATSAELREGGLTPDDRDERCMGGKGANDKKVLQAIDASHLKAIRMAKDRDYEWTAIFEDDAVPINTPNFDRNFRKVWSQLPNRTGFVRLSWCPMALPEEMELRTYYAFDTLHLIDYSREKFHGWYYPGGCTTGYMVRRDFIPRILQIFPCCYASDTCLEWDLFKMPRGCHKSSSQKCWGEEHMMGLTVAGAEKITRGWQFVTQYGILAQDNRVDQSIRMKK